MPSDSPQRPASTWQWVISIALTVLIVGAGAAVIVWLFENEPKAVREGATKKSAMLVRVVDVDKGAFRPTIVSMGEVIPAREVVLRAQVAGEVVEVSDAFVPGQLVAAGVPLVKVDTSDLDTLRSQRLAELTQARAALELEKGQQTVARKEWRRLKGSPARISGANESLVLREPQLKAAKAQVALARAALAQVDRDIERASVEAPFAAQIVRRNVDLGSLVGPGDELARLVGTETYWVEVSVPLPQLRWLQLPDAPGALGARAVIKHQTAWPAGATREGRIFRLLGRLDEQTRMARVLVAVDDPLGRQDRDRQALMLGTYVEVHLEAREIPDVVRLERELLRKGDTVWVMKGDKLDIRAVDVAFRDARYVYVRTGLSGDEKVVASELARVVDGAKLRLAEAK